MSDGQTFETVVEYVPPDRYRIDSESAEIIIINQEVYFKEKDVWVESQMTAGQILDLGFLERLEKSIRDVQFIGTDALNGKLMRAYQYKSEVKVGEGESTAQFELWVGEADGLPYKLVINGEILALDSSTGKAASVGAVTSTLYEYDPTIEIISPFE